MARALSEDLRARAVAAFRAGASCRDVGERFEVVPSSVVKWAKRELETGSLAHGKLGVHRPVKLAPHRDFILPCIDKTPHLTLEKLQAMLAVRNVHICLTTIWLFLQAQGLSFKKTLLASEQGIAQMLPASGGAGRACRIISIRIISSLLMKPG